MSETNKHLVAIIGRPNVGKSTMFNRLVGERKAILDETPGTTRDVLFGTVSWNKASFTVADTAGLEPDLESDLNRDILLQTKAALESATSSISWSAPPKDYCQTTRSPLR